MMKTNDLGIPLLIASGYFASVIIYSLGYVTVSRVEKERLNAGIDCVVNHEYKSAVEKGMPRILLPNGSGMQSCMRDANTGKAIGCNVTLRPEDVTSLFNSDYKALGIEGCMKLKGYQ